MSKKLLQIQPHIRYADYYNYHGAPTDARRQCNLYSFHLFLQEHGSIQVEDRLYPVKPGMLVFIRPGQMHSFHFGSEQQSSSYNIYCDLWPEAPDAMDLPAMPLFTFSPAMMEERMFTTIESCSQLDELPTVHSLNRYPHLSELFIDIYRTCDQPIEPAYKRILLDSMMLVWLLQWNYALQSLPTDDPRIRRVIAEMERYPERRYDNGLLSEISGLEKSHLHKLFRQHTGITPQGYSLRVRMRKAVSMLLESNLSVTSIAEQLGYESIHYFTLKFTKNYGMSPTAFRRLHRG
ncbi:AraC family transcriptional regulator [Paenibacillus sp. NRS-1760]|uniref:AraC family transcriptional regulator n=1 Tax=Paenibacillus sp. NRS-1760 TaxID=3233902 RepID=UPI003D293BBF